MRPTPFSSKLVSGGGSENNSYVKVKQPLTLEKIRRVAEFTPLRLTEEERIMLGVVEGALDHSEFTSNVDVSSNMHYVREAYDRDSRIEKEILEFCRVVLGLSAANDFKAKIRDNLGENLKDREQLFQSCLEVGRRFKITNPEKMRDSYGKLLYLLMDASNPSISRGVGLKLMKPVQTIPLLLDTQAAQEILQDEALVVACSELVTSSPEDARKKAQAQQFLIDRYSEALGGEENVRRLFASLEDALSFLRSNRDPVDNLLEYLQTHFSPNKEHADYTYSLSLQGRNVKPRHELNHNHKTQFTFVLQSLLLWREVMDDFFRLWAGAENDLLNPRNGYNLANTGQGMQRCQNAPATRSNMNDVLSSVQSKTTRWEGLSVVHLGDREVPNALIFIDKYTQVPRIIGPIVRCLHAIENELSQNPATLKFINDLFGSTDACIKYILADLFRGGFDGGGDLGGSCIDGRLTSLWNWSSLIEKKKYYPVFLLSGFIGFDGKF